MIANPYTPGAGFMPAYLAGRENLINHAETYLSSIQKRYPQQSVIYYGLRGVGKTVLLNTIETSADNLNIMYAHIEASENGKFINRLVGALNKFIHEVSIKESAKDFAKKCLGLLKSFTVTYNIEDNTVGIGLQQEVVYSTGVFSEDLTEIFVSLGKAAIKSEDTICIFIDEVQYLSADEIDGLIVAIHRCNQLRLPIMLFCAGLPKILKIVGESRSYTERLFKYEKIDALKEPEARAAIEEPAKDLGVSYDPEAVDLIVKTTGGYPYFIQEFCSAAWANLEDNRTIQAVEAQRAESIFFETLDTGFFAVRYDRCTNREKSFMTAMVKCDTLPCNISNVAKIMKKGVQSISPVRGQLISKGMIYPTGHAEIDFTVPQFDYFIKRINPELKIDKN